MEPETIGADHMIEDKPLPQIGLFQISGSSGSQMPSMRSALTALALASKPKVRRFQTYSGAARQMIAATMSASDMVLALNFHARNRPFTRKKPRNAPREKVRISASAARLSVKKRTVFSRMFFVSHQTKSSRP